VCRVCLYACDKECFFFLALRGSCRFVFVRIRSLLVFWIFLNEFGFFSFLLCMYKKHNFFFCFCFLFSFLEF
jgi:uncharacterized membrane protein